jgi:hypothetical protein
MVIFCNLQVEFIAIYRTNSTSRVNVSVAVGRRVVTEYKLFRHVRAPRINPKYSTAGSERSSLEKSRKYRLRWPSKGVPVEEAESESDSEEEEESEFLDSGLGESNSSSSGFDGSSSLKPSPVEESLEDLPPDRTPSERSREEEDIHNKQPTLENARRVELGVDEPPR